MAAIFVILYHASRHIDESYKTPLLKSGFQFGHAGVDLFFVISGFIILHVHYNDIGDPSQIARYVRRRLTRVFPVYWVALALTIVMQMFHHGLPSLAELFWSIFLLPSDKPIILGIAWTLRFEILFYAMFCLVILNRRLGVTILICWFTIAAFCTASGAKIDFLTQEFQSAFVLEFLFGMVVAYIANEYPIRRSCAFVWVGLLLLALCGALEISGILDGFGSVARIAYGISSALLILGIVVASRANASSVPKMLRAFGRASYSLYIFQFVFIGTAWQLLLTSGATTMVVPLWQFIILSLSAVLGGILASWIIEQPLIRICRSWTSSIGEKGDSKKYLLGPSGPD